MTRGSYHGVLDSNYFIRVDVKVGCKLVPLLLLDQHRVPKTNVVWLSMSPRIRIGFGFLHCKFVVLGDDFRFGADREGDIAFIQEQGRRYNYEAGPTPTFEIEGKRVSSTRIREALERADFFTAEALLGRPYSISGRVIYGRQLGRSIGTPTANLELRRLRAPLSGVYVVEVDGDEVGLERAPGVANVGVRPTVDNSIKANLEVHLLDRDVDLYGRHIEVTFRHKLREEMKFGSIDQLKDNIAKDIEHAKAWFTASQP